MQFMNIDTPHSEPIDGVEVEHSDVHDGASAARLKWGTAMDRGYQLLPDVLLRHFRQLKIAPVDFVVLLNLAAHWYYRDKAPFPRNATIAKRMDLSPRTVQRSVTKLTSLGLLTIERITINGVRRRRYDLKPLANRAAALADWEKRREEIAPPTSQKPSRKGGAQIAA